MANHPGTNMLARVIAGRIRSDTEIPMALDFGELQKNLALVTNTFPIPVPKEDYEVDSRFLNGEEILKPGRRVLVAWVADTPVIVCAVSSGNRLK